MMVVARGTWTPSSLLGWPSMIWYTEFISR
ncbi:Uncharacterised protein [Mycobacteroides abscessus subsp. abscessus]|nr:Uncharacterised protein [Mycobacteroides abscessus subsp. abscessus]